MTTSEKLPSHLRPIWEELRTQVVPEIGTAGLEALCVQVYRMREARERIDREGSVVADAKGNPVPHPALAIERAAQSEVRQWLAKYAT